MKKLVLLIGLAFATGAILTTCPALPAMATDAAAPSSFDSRPAHSYEDLAKHDVPSIGTLSPSCANPTPDRVKKCEELEQQILASTVRVEWNLWVKEGDDGEYSRVDRISHATVKQGRYLVTHNHSQVLSSGMKDKGFNKISIFTADGALIWPKGPLNPITAILEDEETLVLDFGDYGGQGLFTMLGISSAQFKDWESVPLKPGMEVAQVICDGEMAHVEWVKIANVRTEDGTPRLELGNLAPSGTSGGGVFWNGYHVANTWYNGTVYDEHNGTISRQYSVVALNSPHMAAQLP